MKFARWAGLLCLGLIGCAGQTSSAAGARASNAGGTDATCQLNAPLYCERLGSWGGLRTDGVYAPFLDSRGGLMAAVECYKNDLGGVTYGKTLTQPSTPAAIKLFRDRGLCKD